MKLLYNNFPSNSLYFSSIAYLQFCVLSSCSSNPLKDEIPKNRDENTSTNNIDIMLIDIISSTRV